MRPLLLSKRNIHQISARTSSHYESYTHFPLLDQSIKAIQYIVARDYLTQYVIDTPIFFCPTGHPHLREYLHAMDIDPKSKNTSRRDINKHEIARHSVQRIEQIFEDHYVKDDNQPEYSEEETKEPPNQEQENQQENKPEELSELANDESEKNTKQIIGLFKVFDRESFRALAEKSSIYDKEVRRVIKEIDENDTGARRLKKVTSEVFDGIADLKNRYPNMSPFLDFVNKHAALSAHNQYREFWMPPVLLVSSPGLGKTACVKEIAAAIGVPFNIVDYATASASFIMVGSSSGWSSSKPGLIYDMLINRSNAANGLVLCDEIDKSKSTDEKYPPVNVFYRLLEKDIMKEYQDEYIPQLKLDASRLMFVATANSIEGIPEAILSRFHVIQIEKPETSQLRTIAQSIYRSIIESESYFKFDPELKNEVIDCLLDYSPRQIKVILKLAFATAAYRLRYDDDVESITIETEDLDLPDLETDSRQIGFVWD